MSGARRWAARRVPFLVALSLCYQASPAVVPALLDDGVELRPALEVSARTLRLATGLINPRGIAFGEDANLYIAEAGSGGPVPPPIGGAGRSLMVGHTARLSRVDLQGRQDIVLDHLPSLTTTADEFGAADVAWLDGRLYLLTASGGYQVGDADYNSVVLRVDFSGDQASAAPIADLTDYNLTQPSLSRQLDPVRTDVPGGVPFGMAGLYGALYVTDGNQETISRVTPDGQVARVVQYPASNRVLTGISSGPNGSLFIAEFGPAPHRENSARITRWSPNGEFATAEAGFTAAIDVAFDSLGALYVLEFSEPGVRLPNSGRVIRVGPDGSHQVVVSGLNYPTSVAFGPDGNLYVANFGHRSNNGEGEILRVELTTPI